MREAVRTGCWDQQARYAWVDGECSYFMSPGDETSVCACFNFLETLGSVFLSFVSHRCVAQ